MRLRIVGILRRPLDLGDDAVKGGIIVLTPAFNRAYLDRIGNFGVLLDVRTVHGASDVPGVTAAVRRIFQKNGGASPQGANRRDAGREGCDQRPDAGIVDPLRGGRARGRGHGGDRVEPGDLAGRCRSGGVALARSDPFAARVGRGSARRAHRRGRRVARRDRRDRDVTAVSRRRRAGGRSASGVPHRLGGCGARPRRGRRRRAGDRSGGCLSEHGTVGARGRGRPASAGVEGGECRGTGRGAADAHERPAHGARTRTRSFGGAGALRLLRSGARRARSHRGARVLVEPRPARHDADPVRLDVGLRDRRHDLQQLRGGMRNQRPRPASGRGCRRRCRGVHRRHPGRRAPGVGLGVHAAARRDLARDRLGSGAAIR